ncbi:MAG TPA: tRNA-binding protein [Longimicrobiaceae bacterium]|nr:tRNA-binding protein [Longimicrobiaceae bacterium]
MITPDEFEAVEIRAGRVLCAERFPEARKPAYKLLIDFGEHGTKRSSAQVTDLYTPESLEGRTVLAVTNLPPKRIAGFVSEVLVLGVHSDAGVVLLGADQEVPIGGRVC